MKSNMASQGKVLVVVALLTLCFSTTYCFASGKDEISNLLLPSQQDELKIPEIIPWDCCNGCQCGYQINPPQCTCIDYRSEGCDPRCLNCEMIYTVPRQYQCQDVVSQYCGRTCY